jgi:hypothetical protein
MYIVCLNCVIHPIARRETTPQQPHALLLGGSDADQHHYFRVRKAQILGTSVTGMDFSKTWQHFDIF